MLYVLLTREKYMPNSSKNVMFCLCTRNKTNTEGPLESISHELAIRFTWACSCYIGPWKEFIIEFFL